ncbi:MAG: LysM peptidoglycan-binding domain-containing protein [Actinomycetota bacterium]|jgi:nucleoid-associated protein YgaU
MRLTRRGRLVAFSASVAALGAIVIGAGQVAGASGSESEASKSPAPQVVVVQAGETLWGIAREVAPGSDPRGVVRQIRQMNDLGTTPVVPGQSIVVPVLG